MKTYVTICIYVNQITCRSYSEEGSFLTVTKISLKLRPQIEFDISVNHFSMRAEAGCELGIQ